MAKTIKEINEEFEKYIKEDVDSEDEEVAEMEVRWYTYDGDMDTDFAVFSKDEDGTYSFQSELEAGSGYKTLRDATKAAKEMFSDYDSEMYKSVKFGRVTKF